MSYTEYGYLETDYLTTSYLSAFVLDSRQEQVTLKINYLKAIHEQTNLLIKTIKDLNEQTNRKSSTLKGIHEQVTEQIAATKNYIEQVNRNNTQPKSIHEQENRFISGSLKRAKEQVRRGKILHRMSERYLAEDYLRYAYLGEWLEAVIGEQIDRKNKDTRRISEQINRKISKNKSIHEQIKRRIFTLKRIHEQINIVSEKVINEQVTLVLYNATNLRILSEFPSRGLDGLNWTANNTAPGDYSPNNVNTDIVEQIWRSNNGTSTGIILSSDTGIPQGVFVDTLAILNHNMTTSALIEFQGSNDPGFATIGESIPLISKPNNIYYIAPTIPTSSYRYWRLLISDSTNPDGYISIGTIVYGSSIIMQQTCIIDEVGKSTKHFSDKVQTEGFTNVSNDRAIKFATSMQMRNIKYNNGDYQRLRNVFDEARTSLKCLWIPTPKFPDRFAVFGKLTNIPIEKHKVIAEDADYIDFDVEVDESL